MRTESLMNKREEYSTGNRYIFVELVGNDAYRLHKLMSVSEIQELLDEYQDAIDCCKVGDKIRIEREIYGIPYIILFRKETEDAPEMLQNMRTNIYEAD